MGSVREAGEERMGDGIPKGAGAGRNIGNKFCNIVQFFTIEKACRDRNHKGGRNGENKLQEARKLRPPCLSKPPTTNWWESKWSGGIENVSKRNNTDLLALQQFTNFNLVTGLLSFDKRRRCGHTGFYPWVHFFFPGVFFDLPYTVSDSVDSINTHVLSISGS